MRIVGKTLIETGRKLEERRRQADRLKAAYRKRLHARMHAQAEDILASRNFRKTREYVQHGRVSVHGHCLRVAECSLAMKEKLELAGIRCEERDLVRGALLHDYFLYDWHDKERRGVKRLHGFYHPGIALKNAGKEYRLTPREKDIIRKHMWPLTVVPPMCREAWIVTAADKYCSLQETLFGRRRGI